MNTLEKSLKENYWTTILKPRTGWFDINIRELFQYIDLIKIFVYRDFIVVYKQTILGPLWFLIQPIFTTFVFTIVFSNIAKIPTDNIPPMLFYLSGNILWSYFSDCFRETSSTFTDNASIFGKVYFPRLVMPISVVISKLISFFLHFLLFIGFYLFFLLKGAPVQITSFIFIIPILILQMALMSLGFGMIFSALTTKYRDLRFLLQFGLQLWMYGTPIVYPLSQVPKQWQFIISLNPMTAIVELFRKGFLGMSSIQPWHYFESWTITILVLTLGVIIFSKIEKTFMDTV